MTLGLAVKIMKLTKPQLIKKFGSSAKGLAKRVQAGQVMKKRGLRKNKMRSKSAQGRSFLKKEREEWDLQDARVWDKYKRMTGKKGRIL